MALACPWLRPQGWRFSLHDSLSETCVIGFELGLRKKAGTENQPRWGAAAKPGVREQAQASRVDGVSQSRLRWWRAWGLWLGRARAPPAPPRLLDGDGGVKPLACRLPRARRPLDRRQLALLSLREHETRGGEGVAMKEATREGHDGTGTAFKEVLRKQGERRTYKNTHAIAVDTTVAVGATAFEPRARAKWTCCAATAQPQRNAQHTPVNGGVDVGKDKGPTLAKIRGRRSQR
eukprot:5437733-Pleurochrysis_carterae.AAC.2